LTPNKLPMNFEEMLEMETIETETQRKGNEILNIIPEKGIRKHMNNIHNRDSDSNTDSNLNSFEKDFIGMNSDSGSDDDSHVSGSIRSLGKRNSKRKIKDNADSGRILSTQKGSTSRQVPLGSMIRRKSCFCSDCGNLSSLEKKHQNLANPCPREILNKVNEALLKENLKQMSIKSFGSKKSLREEKEIIVIEHFDCNNTEDKTQNTPQDNEHHDFADSFHSRVKTEGDIEAIQKIQNKQKGSVSPSLFKKLKNSPMVSKKNEDKTKTGEGIRSPKNFVLKNLKETVNPENSKKKNPGFLSPIFSPKSTEKSINISTSTMKLDSPPKTASQRLSFLTASMEENNTNNANPLKVFPIHQKFKNMEDSRDSKDSKEEKSKLQIKQNTMSSFFKRKVSEDVPKRKISDFGLLKRKSSDFDATKLQKNDSLPSKNYWGDQEKNPELSMKARSTKKKKSIQGIYRNNTSGNFSPKLPSLQTSPSPMNKMLDALISPKKTSPRPIINIISVNDTESKLGKSPKSGQFETQVGSIEFKDYGELSPITKPSITTLDMSTTKYRKSFFGTTSPKINTAKEKPIRTEMDFGENEEGTTWISTKKRLEEESTSKKRSGKVKKTKRSLSLEKILKAYQLVQGKVIIQGRK